MTKKKIITVSIYRQTHEKLRKALIKEQSKQGKIIPLVQFYDEIIREGLFEKGY